MIQTRFATPLVTRVLILLLPALVLAKGAVFAGLTTIEKAELTDFDAFHIVGRMAWRGDVADAYRFETMMQAQRELGGAQSFMPWTYPPPFDLVVAPLACLPLGLAYLVFTALTLGTFLIVLRRIAGDAFPAVLLATYPALVVTIGCGQNGFLSGTLIGLAVLALVRERAVAGLPLGLMVIKPHLAVAFALHAFAGRRWACMAVAVAVATVTCGVATLLLGPSIWPAFLQGVAEAKAFLVAGLYPFNRMISAYALLRSLDVPATAALAAQGIVALAALSVVVVAIRRRLPAGQVLGFTTLASLLVSPYAYDYDLPIYGIGLALLMPGILRLGTSREQVAIMGLSLVTGGYGLLSTAFYAMSRTPEQIIRGYDLTTDRGPPGLAGAMLPLVVLLVWRILARDPKAATPDLGVVARRRFGVAGGKKAALALGIMDTGIKRLLRRQNDHASASAQDLAR